MLVKGSDWPEEKIVGASEVKEAGGKVSRIPLEVGVSTSDIMEKVETDARKKTKKEAKH